MAVPGYITGRPANRSHPLPSAEDIAFHARRLRIEGRGTAAWILERLALEVIGG
jgi:hypothetical protein